MDFFLSNSDKGRKGKTQDFFFPPSSFTYWTHGLIQLIKSFKKKVSEFSPLARCLYF